MQRGREELAERLRRKRGFSNRKKKELNLFNPRPPQKKQEAAPAPLRRAAPRLPLPPPALPLLPLRPRCSSARGVSEEASDRCLPREWPW